MQQENQADLFNELSLDGTARQHIRTMANWAMTIVVIAVVGYILSLVTLFAMPQPALRPMEGFDWPARVSGSSAVGAVISILIGLLINYFLYRFASQARQGLDGLNQVKMTDSFRNLKSYFMACSIILIVVLILLLLAVVFGLSHAA